MKTYYSKTTNGFYPGSLKADYIKSGTFPDDSIELTPEEVEAYQGKQPPEGKQLGSVNGRPTWVDAPVVPKSPEQLRKESMLTGQPYTLNGTEYQVSFTANDGNGMLQVKSAFEMGLTNTVIHFDNGTKMPITNVEFQDFGLWFVNQRNQYFIEVE